MRLLADLLLRITAVIFFCLAATTAWVLLDAHRGIESATRASAERATRQLQVLYWQELLWRDGLNRAELLPLPDWRNLATARVIAPGTCVGFAPVNGDTQMLCSEAEALYSPAPAWFGSLYNEVFGAFPTVESPLDLRQRVGMVSASADPNTALRVAWMRIVLIVQTAAAMAAAIAALVAVLVARALMPVRSIIEGLHQLENGAYSHRIGGRGRFELDRIAVAVDALGARLGRNEAVRRALTLQLFQVQEDERRALARDLHDEFGQCLAASGALAASIQVGAADRPDVVEDARAIATATRRMMGTLKEALVRLRSQDIDDLGLEACLAELVSKWNGRARAHVELELDGDLSAIPRPVAIGLYRIAQECLTNATRHGAARNIRLRVAGGEAVTLTVDDDGLGDPESIAASEGHGLLGIRERIAALGGSFAIGRAASGIRVAATIPFAPLALPGLA